MMQLTAGWLAAAWLSTAVAQVTPATPPNTPAPPVAAAPASASADASADRAARAAEEAAKAAASMAQASDRIATALEKMSPPAAADAKTDAAKGTLTPADDAAAAADAPQWRGAVGFGLISITGNASTLTLSGSFSAERKSEDWIWAARAAGAYGRARTAAGIEGTSSVTAESGMLQLRGDRRFTPWISAYVLGGAETDHVKSIEVRAYGEGGLGLIWIDERVEKFERMFFRTDLAFRGGQENRFQYYPVPLNLEDNPIAAPRFAATFRYGLNDGVSFIQEAEVLPNLIGNNSVVASSHTRLAARIAEPFSLGVGFRVDFDSKPPAGRVPADTTLTVGIEVGL